MVGHDVLQSGRPVNEWSYAGEDREENNGVISGFLKFVGDGRIVKRPLYWVPSAKVAAFTNQPQPKLGPPGSGVGQHL